MARSCFKYCITSGFLQHFSVRDVFRHVRHSCSVNNASILNIKMLQLFFLCLYFIYFWYFYYFRAPSVPRPKTPGPDSPLRYNLDLVVIQANIFRFLENGSRMWEHVFHDDAYLVHRATETIIERDDCYWYPQRTRIAAKGIGLYKFLKQHPEFQKDISFEENSPYTAQQGQVFYFTCFNRRIESLDMCPSGQIYQNQVCVDISSCTDKADYTHLPVHADPFKYIECKNRREFFKTCPPDTFFYHDHCVPQYNLIYQCTLKDTVLPFKLDAHTLFECRDHKPIYTTCLPGTQLFDNLYCEPDACVGQPDGALLNLPHRTVGPFRFVPGYMECLHEKVFQTVECPSTWDPMLSEGDNLTHLPQVFDGKQCVVPSFGVTVTSDDPDVLVPIHEFTKHVQNWKQSPYYDQTVGYTQWGRKRKRLDPGQRIGKHFKVESACDASSPYLLPIYGHPDQYYNCVTQQRITCPAQHYFTGSACQPEPPHAFKFQGIPLFQFDHLNDEAWIPPWDYPGRGHRPLTGCHTAEDTYLKLYDICVHPECLPYAFLSMVPQVSLFLPAPRQAKCTYDPTDRHIKKESVSFHYTFWDQKVLPEGVQSSETCTVGQKLNTGHFVWDTTLFATCDPAQPFVFCPSPATETLFKTAHSYACAPPPGNTFLHTRNLHWTPFATNEIKRILPPVWDQNPYYFRLNKGDLTRYELPETGFDIPRDTRINLRVNRPVLLEWRYRVTYPPSVAFQYNAQNQLEVLEDPATPPHGFMVRREKFVDATLHFPTYTAQEHVNHFEGDYHP